MVSIARLHPPSTFSEFPTSPVQSMPHIFSRLKEPQQDAVRAVAHLLGYLATAILPPRLDRGIINGLSSLLFRLRPHTVAHRAARIAGVLGKDAESREVLDIGQDYYRLAIENAWGRFRGTHNRAWQPEIRVDGLDEVRAALDRGRGVILWRWSFCSSPVVKIAIWREQIPLIHLSMMIHGACSDSWIGRRVLNPIYRRTEDCYLRERVVIPRTGSHAYMKTLIERLKENSVVSIVGDHTGSQNVTTSFFDGTTEFATGAPSLAWKTGATLLTTYAISESSCSYRVVVDKPIDVDRNLQRKEFAREAIEEFSRRLQAAIVNHPASWRNWGAFLDSEEPFWRPEPEAEKTSLENLPETNQTEAT